MDNYQGNAGGVPRPPGRQPPPQPPRPPAMPHNPHQGPLPHMFGNFNAPPSNAYPQINMPMHMQRPIGHQANPNMHSMQPFPTQFPVSNPLPPGSAPLPSYPPGRGREWERPGQPNAFERDSKRPRQGPPEPVNAAFPNQAGPPPQFNRNGPPGMMPRPPNAGPPVFNPQGQQIPRVPPNNAPVIHPPNRQVNPFPGRQNSFAPSAPGRPAPVPAGPPRGVYPFPEKPAGPFRGPTQGMQGSSFEPLPAPRRKEFLGPSESAQVPAANSAPVSEKAEAKSDPDGPISFKDFLLKQPDTISPQDAKERYDQYVMEFVRRRPNKFFDLHKDQEWFKERYDPDYVLARCGRVQEEVQERARDFIELWREGGSQVCAPDLSSESLERRHVERRGFEQRDVKGPQAKKMEGDVAKVQSDATETGERDATKREATDAKSEDIKTEDKTEDKAEDKTEPELASEKTEEKILPVTSGDSKAEVGVKGEYVVPNESAPENAVSPTFKKESQEEFLARHKGKQNTKEEGSIFQIKLDPAGEGGTPGCSSSGRSLVLPLRREHEKHTIFMRGIPIDLNRDDLTAVLKGGPDGQDDLKLRRLKIGDINPTKGLQRFAWAVYANEERAGEALQKIRGVVVRSKHAGSERNDNEKGSEQGGGNNEEDPDSVYQIDCMLNLQRKKKYTQGRVLPSVLGTPDRMSFDVKQATKIMRCLDKLRLVGENLNPLTDDLLESFPSDGRRLDHIVTYLREVHYFCYYSGNEFLEDATSMPPQELRPTGDRLDRPMSEPDFRLVRRVDERAKWVLERDYDRPRSNSDHAELAKKEAVQKWLESNTKNEGQGRYRCGLPPNKLFKGPEFVHKHLKTKHGDKMEAVKQNAYLETYRANFENDPSKAEVISIYEDGLASAHAHERGQATRTGSGNTQTRFDGVGASGVPQGRTNAPMNLYNAATPFMGMGLQTIPMMMMPTTGYPGAYGAAPGYPNAMALSGRGMGASGMAAQAMSRPGMMRMGMNAPDGGGMHGRPHARNRDGPRDMREHDYHRGGYRDGGHHRGGRRGGHSRRGGDFHRRGHEGRPLDPRASGPRRSYNDLDAPANGPSLDLVRYEDI